MDHFKILKRAWQITWKYRALWLVGLLLVLAGGGIGSGFNGGSAASGGGSGRGGSGGGGDFLPPGWQRGFPGMPGIRSQLPTIVGVVLAVVALIILLVIVLGLVAAVLRYMTRVSLMHMVQSYEETGEEVGFRGGMRMGWSRSAFRLFLIDLMTKLPLALLIALMIAPLVTLAILSFTAGSEPRTVLGILFVLLIFPAVMLGVALGIVLGPILKVTYRVCVFEDLDPWQAFKSALGLIRRHLGPTALQWLLLVGLRIAWGIALIPVNLLLVILALFVGGLPALLVGGIAARAVEWPVGIALGALILVPAFILVVGLPNLALNTLATVYYSTAWTLTYRELDMLDADRDTVTLSRLNNGPEPGGDPGVSAGPYPEVEPDPEAGSDSNLPLGPQVGPDPTVGSEPDDEA